MRTRKYKESQKYRKAMHQFATRLNLLIQLANATQESVACAAGVSAQQISNYLAERVLPSCESLIKIADYFGTSTDFLLGLTSGQTGDANNSIWESEMQKQKALKAVSIFTNEETEE